MGNRNQSLGRTRRAIAASAKVIDARPVQVIERPKADAGLSTVEGEPLDHSRPFPVDNKSRFRRYEFAQRSGPGHRAVSGAVVWPSLAATRGMAETNLSSLPRSSKQVATGSRIISVVLHHSLWIYPEFPCCCISSNSRYSDGDLRPEFFTQRILSAFHWLLPEPFQLW